MRITICLNDTEYTIEGSIVYEDELDIDCIKNESGQELSEQEIEKLVEEHYVKIYDEMLIETQAYNDDYDTDCRLDNERYEANYEDRFSTY